MLTQQLLAVSHAQAKILPKWYKQHTHFLKENLIAIYTWHVRRIVARCSLCNKGCFEFEAVIVHIKH